MTFLEFIATRVPVASLAQVIPDYEPSPLMPEGGSDPGMTYLSAGSLYISKVQEWWPEDARAEGEWHLVLANCEWIAPLELLEARLYVWAQGAGYFDAHEGAKNFWATYERHSNNAKATEVGKLMVAAGYDTAHTGGGCMCWEKVLANKCYLWICDEGNGLGDTVSEPYLVGLYDMHGEPLDSDLMPNLKMALEWCESRIECSGEKAEAAMCRELKEWCEREGLPYMSADEIEPITPKQREWLASYISRWEAMSAANMVAEVIKTMNPLQRQRD